MKTLRLTFAMGGGVSLGSFSGAALTEILRALVLHGQDREGKPYDRVVLDSMSGASAGAIALAILMRSLMDYEAVADIIVKKYWLEIKEDSPDFYELKEKNSGPGQDQKDFIDIIKRKAQKLIEDQVTKSLTEEETSTLCKQLMAIEVAQILQEILWVRETNIKKLLKSNPKTSAIENFSLLPRDNIIEQTRTYLLPEEDINLQNQQVVGKRVLFACSLTNLVPNKIVENVEGVDLNQFPLLREVKRALNSKSHKELRIFDFKLQPNDLGALDSTEFNWLEISPANTKRNENNPLWHDIASKETWARIAASVIACGAFPIAFSPVILKRWKAEFPRYDHDKGPNSTQQYNSVWELPNVEAHKLPYVDGGTFNNEPIREAFRLANYIDTNLRKNHVGKKEEVNFDRLVVFVDPIVDSKDLSYHMSSYSQLSAKVGGDGLRKVTHQKTFSKVASLTGRLIGMLRNQGSVKEEHKISNYLDQVQLKARLSAHLNQLQIPIDDSKEELELFKEIIHHVEKALLRGEIPLGTRDIGKYLFWTAQDELKRYMDSYPDDSGESLQKGKKPHVFLHKFRKDQAKKFAELFGIMDILKAKSAKKEVRLSPETFSQLVQVLKDCQPEATAFSELFDQVFDKATPFYDDLREFIKRVFLNITINTALDIDGKDPRAVQLAITPVSYAPPGSNDAKTIALPGSEIQAFGGFTSRASRDYSFNYGRYCALQSLQRKDVRSYYAELKLDPAGDPDIEPQPFISQTAFSDTLTYFKELLDDVDSEKTSDGAVKNLNQALRTDFELLKKGRLIRPFLHRLMNIFPEFKRSLIKWGIIIFLAFMAIFLGTYFALEEHTFWALLVGLATAISLLTLSAVVYGIWKLFEGKKDFRDYFYTEMDTFPNYEITLLWPSMTFGKKVKAVRFNDQGRYIKTVPFEYNGKAHTAVKLYIRQTESEGYHRSYDLFFDERAERNWNKSPFSAYEASLNQKGENAKKVDCIHFSTRTWFGRLWRFGRPPEASIQIDSSSLDKAKIERLKFYIDPAILLEQVGSEYHFGDYICLTKELEKLILEV
jgi:predicted acylesterase/phospholipase RssA